jgi:hypothetical protein
MIARAFRSLPERWQAVLWHTDIEASGPAEIAWLLGLSANSVAALAYRAREGLRQAYLQMHLSEVVRQECRPIAGKLGGYVRDGLSGCDAAKVAAHHAPRGRTSRVGGSAPACDILTGGRRFVHCGPIRHHDRFQLSRLVPGIA